jgi:hypothetical protein
VYGFSFLEGGCTCAESRMNRPADPGFPARSPAAARVQYSSCLPKSQESKWPSSQEFHLAAWFAVANELSEALGGESGRLEAHYK